MDIKDHFGLSRHLLPAIASYLDFFSPLGFDAQTNSDHKTQNIKFHSVTALKRYLNEENLIHGRVMATISKFSPQIFQTYFNTQFYKNSDLKPGSTNKFKH